MPLRQELLTLLINVSFLLRRQHQLVAASALCVTNVLRAIRRLLEVNKLATFSVCAASFVRLGASHYVALFWINMISSKQTASIGRVSPHAVKRTPVLSVRCLNSSEQKSRQCEPQQSRRALLACLSAFCALQTPGW